MDPKTTMNRAARSRSFKKRRAEGTSCESKKGKTDGWRGRVLGKGNSSMRLETFHSRENVYHSLTSPSDSKNPAIAAQMDENEKI